LHAKRGSEELGVSEQNSSELRRVFELALAAAPADRSALLEHECAGDAELRRRIEAMLAAAEDDRFLGEATADMSPSSGTGAAPRSATDGFAALKEGPGTRIGPYKLLQLIGEGGFGSVFMAEQERPVSRKVALKVIKLGMDTRAVIARFEAERQALAMMDHPNIARVLDAGATEAGRPYFVMELCKGDPITTYCDKHGLGIRERLELFAQVCQAVQHAHSKGVIHRDLKPSNILVSSQDSKPSAKVIDFGIAKATASKLTEKTLFTEHRQLIGTPEYMSPEQAEGSLDIDTRTDVYSLGVLLYEMLTGSTPFDARGLRSAAYAEIQRIIRHVDPPKPSTRLSEATDTVASVAASRRTEPRKLGAIVRGELDWIVMKALDKDRTRRYETANSLAADVLRYLSGDAITAAPPSTTYRVRKFVSRHRAGVIAASVLLGVLILGIAGTSAGLVIANRQRALALSASASEAQQRKIAEARLVESQTTLRFIDEMLGSADPAALGKDVSVQSVLKRAAADIDARFKDRPLVAASLHGTIGRTYLGLGEMAPAEAHLRRVVEIRREQLGEDHEDTRRAINDLSLLMVKRGALYEGEKQLKSSIETNTRLFGHAHEITVTSMDILSGLYAMQNRAKDAEPLAREVVAARLAPAERDRPEAAEALNALGGIEADLGHFEESEKLFERAIELADRVSGPDHPYTLQTRSNFALALYTAAMQEEQAKPDLFLPRLNRAKDLNERVLQARTRLLGDEHPDTLTSMNNLASVYKSLGMPERAEPLQRKDLEISLRTLGEEHPDTIVSLGNLGNTLRGEHRCEEALPYLQRAVRAARKSLPKNNPGTAYNLGWLGSCLRDLGRYAEAEPMLLEAREIIVASRGEEHPIARQMALGLQTLYEAWDKAEPGKGHDAKSAEWKMRAESRKP
jgi:serine/threonine protein kinase/tetratricopeptide (TPR) repeat protein